MTYNSNTFDNKIKTYISLQFIMSLLKEYILVKQANEDRSTTLRRIPIIDTEVINAERELNFYETKKLEKIREVFQLVLQLGTHDNTCVISGRYNFSECKNKETMIQKKIVDLRREVSYYKARIRTIKDYLVTIKTSMDILLEVCDDQEKILQQAVNQFEKSTEEYPYNKQPNESESDSDIEIVYESSN